MKKLLGLLIFTVTLVAFTGMARASEPAENMQVAISKNPCAMKNPCTMANPCAMEKHKMMNPCTMKNPCSMMNPCAMKKHSKAEKRAAKASLKYGKKLWKDKSLGNSGQSCSTCHPKGKNLYNTPYPRYVKMPNKVITLKGMINFCMKVPMQAEPLDVNGKKMKALVSYINAYSSAPDPASMRNPCMMGNPCGMKNPCAMKNPCGRK
ncbi:hypothetical protein MNBD_DELTA01-1127 [hydrothermal vent metagenome]|uniref:Cytochrome c domain-containing protein n=1 Tax=hydrothermal vent metagenome TaxID=652676 RepID=A0A3B0QWK1_9ZZZZ